MDVIQLDREVPEVWLLGPAVATLKQGGLVVLPTDSIYALACDPWNTQAVTRLYKAKGMDSTKRCSIMCGNLKQVGAVARAVGREAFQFMRSHFPGAFTILLHASRELPRQATGKRKSIGVRIPDHVVSQTLMQDFGGPVLVSSLPNWEAGELLDPVMVAEQMPVRPDLVLDQGPQLPEPSTVVDFTVDPAELVRQGKGPVEVFA